MLIKTKIKIDEKLSYMDWVTFKNYFFYNRILSDKKPLLKLTILLSKCSTSSNLNNKTNKIRICSTLNYNTSWMLHCVQGFISAWWFKSFCLN